MDAHALLRQLLRIPHASRTMITTTLRPQTRTFALLAPHGVHPRHLTTPRILQPSFWATLIPKPLRERSRSDRRREWNPATPYIILSLLVGSQAIQLLWLKQERARSLRRAEAKIGILREVIERVQAGEEVDVEKVLGAGDEAQEAEWMDGELMAFASGAGIIANGLQLLRIWQRRRVCFRVGRSGRL